MANQNPLRTLKAALWSVNSQSVQLKASGLSHHQAWVIITQLGFIINAAWLDSASANFLSTSLGVLSCLINSAVLWLNAARTGSIMGFHRPRFGFNDDEFIFTLIRQLLYHYFEEPTFMLDLRNLKVFPLTWYWKVEGRCLWRKWNLKIYFLHCNFVL